MVRGVRNSAGLRLPPLRCFMDDVTSLLQTAVCTARLLKRFEELLSWARMRIKSKKSRSLSIRKGRQMDSVSFLVAGERIPVLAEQPLRSLGREYTADLSDKHMAAAVTDQLKEGLKRIDQSYLPGKFKVWCYQFTLYQRVMWPLKMCEITATTVTKLDAKANNYIKKWLGLPRCLSDAALFGRNALQLPVKNISTGYRLEKSRLVLELRQSSDHLVCGQVQAWLREEDAPAMQSLGSLPGEGRGQDGSQPQPCSWSLGTVGGASGRNALQVPTPICHINLRHYLVITRL
ncbi:hypothetical protein ROHU_018794 [Xyrichtys novacula]|uniref:Uncharacterized protein n=1 Tax=Xyrichtys novacula TaxID=13765 RepID=A0AAV1FKB0_XYRNO|nr:hypothetical protein ROHU_018794 [Xyrichtys novacula]